MVALNIYRNEKLKTAAAIRGVSGHNSRTRPTPSADPKAHNIVLLDGGPDLYATVIARIEAAGAKVRRNSVLAMEHIHTASPEYFRPSHPERAGEWDQRRLDAWVAASWQWIQEEFADTLVDARLHLDESTPHIQFVTVPLTDDGRLSAREMFGRRRERELQTKSAAAVAHLGIERGVPGSMATHARIQQFYGAVNARVPAPPKVSVPPLQFKGEARQDWAREETQRIAEEHQPVRDGARAKDLAERRRREAVATARKAMKSAEAATVEVKRLAASLRDVPLEAVLEHSGFDPDPGNAHLWLGERHRIRLSGVRFYDQMQDIEGSKAIDLTMHIHSCDFVDAVGWLSTEFGVERAAAAVRASADIIAESSRPQPYVAPAPAPEVRGKIRSWLTEVRKVGQGLVDSVLEKGLVYGTIVGRNINAVFPFQKGRGAEVRGTDQERKFAGLAKGSNRARDGWWMRVEDGPPGSVVACKSVLDALSYIEMHPGVPLIAASTSGLRPRAAWLDKLLAEGDGDGRELVVAYDTSEAGQEMAEAMRKHYEKAGVVVRVDSSPDGAKDWNEALQIRKGRKGLDSDHEPPMPSPST